MEFFTEINNANLTENGWNKSSLKELLSIKNLPALCNSIDSAFTENKKNKIYCSWGEFEINREEIDYGVRFTLPHCPNALAWTITHDENTNKIILHCTINKQVCDEDFVDSIKQFMIDWEFNPHINPP